jgi:tRNA pseudouridine55 synthase
MNGIVVIDKPAGWTSRAVVEEVKRVLGTRKAGHTGTLDPLATGVLPVCVNEATKLVQFLALDDKEYRATLLLGVRTDTLDTEGRVLSREEPHVSAAQIEEALRSLTGRRDQMPPRYSAVKVRGRPLYDWTRRGIDVAAAPRPVEIYRIAIEVIRLPEVTFAVACSKGTYIRSLCAEAGEQLGCGATLSALRRTASGCFTIGDAVALEALSGAGEARLRPLVDILPNLAAVEIDGALAQRIRQGYQPEAGVLERYHIPFLAAGDVIKFIHEGKHLVAVARMVCSSRDLATEEAAGQAVTILRVFED